MDHYYTIKGFVLGFIAIIFTVILAVSVDLVRVDLKPLTADLRLPINESPFQKQTNINAVTRALQQSLPYYYKHLLDDPTLTAIQKSSLENGYMPVIEEFIESGDPKLIEKAEHLKRLIMDGTITILKTDVVGASDKS
mgnify:CR=1 FL=1